MVPITFFRSSSFGAHEFCPMRYYLEYTLGWRGKGNKKADKGTIVHKTMEILAGAKKAQQDDQLIYHDEEADIMVNASDPMTIDIDKLNNEVYDYYTSHFTHHDWDNKDRRECSRWVYKALEFRGGFMDPRGRTIVQPEQHFSVELDYDWAAYEYEVGGEILKGNLELKGTIDLVTQVDESTYEVIDWKTGARKNWNVEPVKVKEYEDFYNDMQLRIYHLACCKMYPDIDNIWMTIYFINDGGPFTIMFERSDIEYTLDKIREKFELIKNTEMPERKRTWKCAKFCHQGTTTFDELDEPDSPVDALTENRYNQVARAGQIMTKCDQCHYYLTHRDSKTVIENLKHPDHEFGKYKAPGSTE